VQEMMNKVCVIICLYNWCPEYICFYIRHFNCYFQISAIFLKICNVVDICK
jgi:hypothetical protein